MFELLIGVVIGLFVGWNVFPQPVWVQELYSKWFGKGE